MGAQADRRSDVFIQDNATKTHALEYLFYLQLLYVKGNVQVLGKMPHSSQ